jgi:succinyl-diaminopimelate desuccinylase
VKEHIVSYIQDHEEEIVRLSTELIGANTVNPPGNEYLAVNIIKKYFNAHGIRYDVFEKITGRSNIIGYIGKGNPTLLVACHLDVVPPGDGWDSPDRPRRSG